jgi:hypothetical protein
MPLTLLAGSMVKLTARPYLQVYSDQNCPSVSYLQQQAMRSSGPSDIEAIGDPASHSEHAGDRCLGNLYDDGTKPHVNPIYDAVNYVPGATPGSGMFRGGSQIYNPADPRYQEDNTGVLERFTGVRFFLQAVVELAVSPNLSIWGLIEGAPGQKDRQMFTDKFNRIFPLTETPIYGRAGLSLKF